MFKEQKFSITRRNFILSSTAIAVATGCSRITVLGEKNNYPQWHKSLKNKMKIFATEITKTLKPWIVPYNSIKVDDYGAVGDGKTMNTLAIQSAIDKCSALGGGTVRFERGEYVTGTIVLKSGVMLEVAREAKILGSTSLKDYPHHIAKRTTVMDTHMEMNQSLIFAEGVNKVGIRGDGMIDFRGSKENFPGLQTIGKTPGRVFGIRMLDSSNIVVENITLKDASCWMQNYLNCEDLIFQNMKVSNHANHNNDGLDIDGCRRVIVRNCIINSEDDAMCIKGASLRPTEDVLIENSTFVTVCNALKIGTDTQGDFRRIYARNLILGGIPENMHSSRGHQASTGITLATVDGGTVEDIFISGVDISRTRAPIFIRIGNRLRGMPTMSKPPVGKLRRIIIENGIGDGNFRQGSLISGISSHPITDVVLENFQLNAEGGGTEELIRRELPEKEDGYPDAQGFNRDGLPSHGFYVRHAKNIHFKNVKIATKIPDARPEFLCGKYCNSVLVDGFDISNKDILNETNL
jgi:polygalacturonase